MTEGICPCCGGPLFDRPATYYPQGRVLIVGEVAVRFSKYQDRIFSALWQARERGGGCTSSALMDAMYFDDPNGGASARSIVSVQVCALRKALKPASFGVKRERGGLYILTGR